MEKRYEFEQIEKPMQDFWEEEKVYLFDSDGEGEVFSIDTPPPTVSGSLHIGHLFSYTQTEIIARFRRMQGYRVFYPFGFDDNGLPTERLVERDEGIRAGKLPRGEFVVKCRHTAERYEEEFRAFWKSLGFSVDWSLQYQTISPEVCRLSQELFLELVEQGRAYAKESPVLWCTECGTSIAQAELDTVEMQGLFYDIPFAVDGEALMVATTRPELLFGCVCLFVNPQDVRYQRFVGKTARVPLYEYDIPVLADEKADPDKGTGAVMCATFGDSTDAEWFLQYALPYRRVLGADGRIAQDVPFLAGLGVREAREEVVRLLREQGLVEKTESVCHGVGVHERCGKEVEIILSRQWYIDVLSQREMFLELGERIRWHPASMKSRYVAWVENLKWDWCISRQRYFGVPFPVWYCEDCGESVFALPGQLPVNPLEVAYEGVCRCGCRRFVPERAVFDTWATSSITPQINQAMGLRPGPMAMRSHAHEIIRTWTFYTIVRSFYHAGDIPWKDLMICGFVLAKKGEKVSKSKNNQALDPKHLIAAHSADVLRYWTAGARLGTDTFFAPEELAVPKRFITKLWNAARFAISHLEDFDLCRMPELLPIDAWIVERVKQTTARASELLESYEIGAARQEIDVLFWRDYCDNYIEIVKNRLYEPEQYEAGARESAQYALYYALLQILKLYAIYVPHITEFIYQEFFRRHEGGKSIHTQLWGMPGAVDEKLLQFGEAVKEAVFAMRKYKSEHKLSMRAETELLEIGVPAEFLDWMRLTERDLQACANAKAVRYRVDEAR